jgi:hypothetical protein
MNKSHERTILNIWKSVIKVPRRGEIARQRRAFKLLLVTSGGIAHLVRRSSEELENLAKRKICGADLRKTLRQLAAVELRSRRAMEALARAKSEKARLIRHAGDPDPRSNNPHDAGPACR